MTPTAFIATFTLVGAVFIVAGVEIATGLSPAASLIVVGVACIFGGILNGLARK